ncbi:MAG: stress response translation initiation inhibitor YciH [Candidatus Aenigmarchaeota archaeon ex4484_224]|nr:MAG: stress response translation initiation inhibitor YciH [Candidatus Aenigmarchaeota archaeon ex4484_224]
MVEICPKCGLPKDLCVCDILEKEKQKIRVFVEKRRYGKPMTIIEGITDKPKEVLSELKSKLACGGTYKENHLELQGDHRAKIKDILVKMGYREDQIEII